jgi:hypothetical protein
LYGQSVYTINQITVFFKPSTYTNSLWLFWWCWFNLPHPRVHVTRNPLCWTQTKKDPPRKSSSWTDQTHCFFHSIPPFKLNSSSWYQTIKYCYDKCNYQCNCREFVNFVILDGQLSVKIVELLVVVLLIIPHHKFFKDNNMIILLIYGV